jgi:hypothetical protein
MLGGVVLDLVVIRWAYVVSTYVTAPPERVAASQ